MGTKLDERISDAIEELEDWVKDNPGMDPDYDGTLHEIADSSTPVYNSDILDIAAEDYEMAILVPEIGPAFDGTPTPINIIAANIYEAIYTALCTRWYEIEKEQE